MIPARDPHMRRSNRCLASCATDPGQQAPPKTLKPQRLHHARRTYRARRTYCTHRTQRTHRTPRAVLVLGIVLGLALVALGLLTQPVHAAEEDTPHIHASAELELEIPIEALRENTAEPTVGAAGCTKVPFSRSVDERRFTFNDGATRHDCAEMLYDFTVPEGLRTFSVRFTADRTIVEGGDTSTAPIVAIQQAGVYDVDTLNILASVSYHDSSERSAPPREERITVAVPEGTRNLTAQWYFEERGPQVNNRGSLIPSNVAFSANVLDPYLQYDEFPIGVSTLVSSAQAQDDENGTIVTTTVVALDVPNLAERANDALRVIARFSGPDQWVGIRSPAGTQLNVADFTQSTSAGGRVVFIDPATINTHGAGTYLFTFQDTTALPPPPAPTPPATIFPIIYLASLLPIPPAAFSYVQAYRVRQQAAGAKTGRVGSLFVAASILTLGYVALLLVVYVAGRLDPVATLPLGVEAVLVLGGFIVLAVLFLILGLFVARTVMRAMERDLEERRRIQLELERSNQELEHFAYVASHDLQEPLRTISGFSQLLRRRYGDQLDERAIKYISRTVQGTERMGRLIDDLLAYSRVGSRGHPIQETDMARIAREVLADLESMIHEAGAKVEVGALPTIPADSTQIAQVLSNLVRNAIKYRHPERAPTVKVSASEGDKQWTFKVADNGMGIPAEQQERAFVIFQRLVAREQDDTGTGLGLAISKKIVERHGGTIWVDSDGETGSTFSFTLPKVAIQEPDRHEGSSK